MLHSKAPEKVIRRYQRKLLQDGFIYAPERTILVDGKARQTKLIVPRVRIA